jgi:hypothetical protein
MLEPTTHVKLCTCEPERIDPSRCWRLYRDGMQVQAVGGFIPALERPPLPELLRGKIASDLNGRECFDFSYEPTAGDVLEISLAMHLFQFWFTGDCWLDADTGGFFPGEPTEISGNVFAA